MKKPFSSRRRTSGRTGLRVEKKRGKFSFPGLNVYTKKVDKQVTLSRVRELLGVQGVSQEASCSP